MNVCHGKQNEDCSSTALAMVATMSLFCEIGVARADVSEAVGRSADRLADLGGDNQGANGGKKDDRGG